MAGTIYGTTELLGVMRQVKVLNPFWLTLFPQQINFETEDIAFDRVSNDYRRLAPFVAPNVQGRVQGRSGYDTVSFKPAYVKPKDVVDPSMDIVRQAGEALGTGSLSNAQRRDAVIAEILRQHRSKLVNRNEWLAARAIIDGQVTIAGDDYPAVTVNFRRHSSLSYTLAGGALWSAGTATPLLDIKAAKLNADARSGVRITKLVLGGDAWDLFANHANVNLKEMMNNNYGGMDTKVSLMRDGWEGQEYMGIIQGLNGAGRIEAWVDTSKYVDENGVEQFFLDQKTVVGISGAVEGVRCFGAIRDVKAGLQAREVFTKMWENEDPSVEYIMSQSAPLMVPKRPNATFKIKVAV